MKIPHPHINICVGMFVHMGVCTHICVCVSMYMHPYIYIDTYISLPQKEFITTEHTEVKLCTNLLTSAFLRLFFFFFEIALKYLFPKFYFLET